MGNIDPISGKVRGNSWAGLSWRRFAISNRLSFPEHAHSAWRQTDDDIQRSGVESYENVAA
jgi:hypothetical protein